MGFFDRNRAALAERGIDATRLPPGQYFTDRFPVLHVGDVPSYDLTAWDLQVGGLVRQPLRLSFDELRALPATEVLTDIHCVTKWSKFDTTWRGVRVRDLLDLAGRDPAATHVVGHAEFGYSANLPLEDVLGDKALVAYEYEGAPLEAEHGFPARLVVPHLYFWKSVKWLRGLELTNGDQPGFWERNGYHNYGDPFREQRYWGD
ncbi:MAG: molybdopterin-dependent oxidoreductase [Acidimicrobiia bacterium]|nr:molybdopterin-dependent oxidoreductase [Acidimicrobiia bacterium]